MRRVTRDLHLPRTDIRTTASRARRTPSPGFAIFVFSGSLYIGLSLLLCVITTYLLLRLLAVNELGKTWQLLSTAWCFFLLPLLFACCFLHYWRVVILTVEWIPVWPRAGSLRFNSIQKIIKGLWIVSLKIKIDDYQHSSFRESCSLSHSHRRS